MKHKESKGRNLQQVETAMFASYLLVFAFLATCRGQSGLPRFFQDPTGDSADGSPLYYDPYGPPAGADLWPDGSTGGIDDTAAVQSTASTTQPPHTSTQDSNEAVEESAVWKIALVVAVLLVSVVGSLSMAYYLCFWRGGRFYYQPQKEGES